MVGVDRRRACSTRAKRCCEQWGIAKVTIDDIATEPASRGRRSTGCSPAARTCCSNALRVHELEDFFTRAQRGRRGEGCHDRSRSCSCAPSVHATAELRSDQHLAIMLASEPGETLSAAHGAGLPRIIRWRRLFLTPLGRALPRPAAGTAL